MLIQLLKNRNIFRVFSSIGRNTQVLFKLRLASHPYITGDGFRKIAQHVFDETTKKDSFDPLSVKQGDIVFVKSDMLDVFFTTHHRSIVEPYKLITHNGDRNISEADLKYIDNNIIHWYAQNVNIVHPKITPIPIGLENRWYFINGIPFLFNYFRKRIFSKRQNEVRTDKILFGFNVATNVRKRELALQQLRARTDAVEIKGPLTPYSYLAELGQYTRVASPEGNGLDCHRTWEALYLGTIPIVTRSAAAEYFHRIGIPLCIIDTWNDIPAILPVGKTCEFLYMDYWVRKIKSSSGN